jgi:DNA-binding transcriptional LysR family regulator
MRELKLDHLQTFIDVIELGGFSAAAERLQLSQPAVSLQIRQLERQLGVRLIERVGKQAMPTAAGAELLEHARRINADVKAALDGMASFASGTLGRVRIGTGATASIYLLPPILGSLRQQFPDLEITVRTGYTGEMLKWLEESVIDIGFVTLPAEGRNFEVTPVLEDDYVAISAADDDRLEEVVTPISIASLPLILFETGLNTRRIIDEWFARAGVRLKAVMHLDSIEAIKELVGAGHGYAIVPGSALRRAGERVPLIRRPLSPMLHRKIGLVVHRDKPMTRGVRETFNAIRRLG